jgi:hypothetical protein
MFLPASVVVWGASLKILPSFQSFLPFLPFLPIQNELHLSFWLLVCGSADGKFGGALGAVRQHARSNGARGAQGVVGAARGP